jgi:hypothetical protein
MLTFQTISWCYLPASSTHWYFFRMETKYYGRTWSLIPFNIACSAGSLMVCPRLWHCTEIKQLERELCKPIESCGHHTPPAVLTYRYKIYQAPPPPKKKEEYGWTDTVAFTLTQVRLQNNYNYKKWWILVVLKTETNLRSYVGTRVVQKLMPHMFFSETIYSRMYEIHA